MAHQVKVFTAQPDDGLSGTPSTRVMEGEKQRTQLASDLHSTALPHPPEAHTSQSGINSF